MVVGVFVMLVQAYFVSLTIRDVLRRMLHMISHSIVHMVSLRQATERSRWKDSADLRD